LLVPAAAPALAAPKVRQIDYVALEDSMAAGVLGKDAPDSTHTDFGYPNVIARYLSKVPNAAYSFDKSFCEAGETAANLAVKTSGPEVYALLTKAEIVTLDIGANDVLGPLYDYYQACTEANPEPTLEGALPALAQMISHLPRTGKGVQKNIEKILQNIINANRHAKIYIIGYYNPLPGVNPNGLDLEGAVAYFNSFIMKAAANAALKNFGVSITYIPTMVPMAAIHPEQNLNPHDIHPTIEGQHSHRGPVLEADQKRYPVYKVTDADGHTSQNAGDRGINSSGPHGPLCIERADSRTQNFRVNRHKPLYQRFFVCTGTLILFSHTKTGAKRCKKALSPAGTGTTSPL
jgi:hypothetical protein